MTHVTRELFGFLRELRRHNNREWFNANKERYLGEVRDPLLAFIQAIAPRLTRISPHIVADARPSGGSLLRIYRDTRFSRDRTPYKTNAGLSFGLDAPRDFDAPGYYLHLAPGEVFMGAGIWRPSADALRAIREAIGPLAWRSDAEAAAAGLRPRPPAHRRSQAAELHSRRGVQRAAGLRTAVSHPLRRGLPRSGAADEIPGAGDGSLLLTRSR